MRSNGHDTQSEKIVPPQPLVTVDELELLTVDDLAHLWKVTAGQIRRQARSGGLPFVRIGRYIRFHERDAQAWLAARKNATPRKRS